MNIELYWSDDDDRRWREICRTVSDLEESEVLSLEHIPRKDCEWYRYARIRLAGESHRLALMLATRKPPGIVTDSVFLKERRHGQQFASCPALGNYYRRTAEGLGQSTTGKVYLPSLADFPGDPSAWVSGRGDVERVARAKGYGVSGLVNVKPSEREPIPDVEIAPEIVEREVAEILRENPDARPEDVREQVYALRTGKVDPNPLLVEG